MLVEGDWRRDGFVVIQQALAPSTVATLRVEAERCVARHTIAHRHGRPGSEDNPEDPSDIHILRNLHRPCDGPDSGSGPPHIGPPLGSAGFRTLLESIAQPDVLALLQACFGAAPLFRGTALWINPLTTSEEGRCEPHNHPRVWQSYPACSATTTNNIPVCCGQGTATHSSWAWTSTRSGRPWRTWQRAGLPAPRAASCSMHCCPTLTWSSSGARTLAGTR